RDRAVLRRPQRRRAAPLARHRSRDLLRREQGRDRADGLLLSRPRRQWRRSAAAAGMRAALARAAAAALPGDPPQPARRLLRDRLLPAREPQADDDRDGAGVARIPATLFPFAASE